MSVERWLAELERCEGLLDRGETKWALREIAKSRATMDALPTDERLFAYGTAGRILKERKLFDGALPYFEELTRLAERWEPQSIKTARDFVQLSFLYAELRRPQQQYDALRKARTIYSALSADERNDLVPGELDTLQTAWESLGLPLSDEKDSATSQRSDPVQVGGRLHSDTAAKVHPRFWQEVSKLCVAHVEGEIRKHRNYRAPMADWTEQRLRQLIEPARIATLIATAGTLITAPESPTVWPTAVERNNAWHVVVSVYPTTEDKDLLRACPDQSYEALALACRHRYRSTNQQWEALDVAHWVLELDLTGDAAIHLHTIWNVGVYLAACKAARERGTFQYPPIIIPTDLLRDEPKILTQQLIDADLEALRQKQGGGERQAGR